MQSVTGQSGFEGASFAGSSSPISLALELSSFGTAVCMGFRLGTKVVVSCIWIFILLTSIIALEGCVFWGVQPHESVVDVRKLYYLNLCIRAWMHIVNWSFLCPTISSCWLYTSNLLVYICQCQPSILSLHPVSSLGAISLFAKSESVSLLEIHLFLWHSRLNL